MKTAPHTSPPTFIPTRSRKRSYLFWLGGGLSLLPYLAYAASEPRAESLVPLLSFILGVGGTAAYFLLNRESSDDSGREERSHAAMLFSSAHVSFYYHNLETHKEWFSRKLRLLLNITTRNPNFSAFAEFMDERDFDRLKQAMVDLKAGSAQIRQEFLLKDGRVMECYGVIKEERGAKHLILWWQDISDRNAQLERLRKENDRLKQELQNISNTLNALPIPVWQRDAQFKIRYCNLAFMEAAEENPGASSEVLELYGNAPQLARSAIEAGRAIHERRYIVLHGERRPYDLYEIPSADKKFTTGMALDISEMERVREEMERITSAQSDLLESAGSAMAIYGPDQKLRFYNSAFARLWQLEDHWLETHPRYSDVLEKLRESRSLPEQANFAAFKQQHVKMFTDLIAPQEEYYYLPDGRTLRALATPHALGGVLFAYEDVTDRLALERSYNTLIAVQKATLDNLQEGVAVFGEDGRLKLSNPVYIGMWDLSPEIVASGPHVSDLLNRNQRLFRCDDWESFSRHFVELVGTRETRFLQIERTDQKIFEVIFVPLPDGQTLINSVDITDTFLVERSLRERNEALQDADKVKSQFLANISYELRSPLTSISGFTEMLRQDYFGRLTDRQQEYLSNIQEASRHLSNLINDILDIASIEAGYMDLNVTRFDIAALLQSVLTETQPMSEPLKLALKIDCDPKIGGMEGDEHRIRQVMLNLLANSLRYTEEGGTVHFGAKTSIASTDASEEIVFWVEDNGMGIAENEIDSVFDKFYRTASTTRVKTGTGLGLSMVKSFVELHGGRVELSSQQGIGTKVTCYFPRRAQTLRTLKDRDAA